MDSDISSGGTNRTGVGGLRRGPVVRRADINTAIASFVCSWRASMLRKRAEIRAIDATRESSGDENGRTVSTDVRSD